MTLAGDDDPGEDDSLLLVIGTVGLRGSWKSGRDCSDPDTVDANVSVDEEELTRTVALRRGGGGGGAFTGSKGGLPDIGGEFESFVSRLGGLLLGRPAKEIGLL